MRGSTVLTLIATLCALSGAARPSDGRRAYFHAHTPEARQRLAPFIRRELPGGIVSAEIPPAMLQTFSAEPGLTFVGYEAVLHPAPIAIEEVTAEATRTRMAGTTRPCTMPRFINPVGWGIKAVYADPNLIHPSGGAGVRVGVVDTGVSAHPDLVRRLVKCVDLTPSELLPACADSMNHGTLVASVIAADGGADGLGMYGVAPEASIYSYRVCDPNSECWGAYVADGIYAAIADSVNIINLSLDGPGHDEAIQAAIRAAVAHNIIVVGAAGNNPPYSHVGYPAVYPEVLSVGAIAENREPWPFTAAGINDGNYIREEKEIEMAAPGAAVLAALKSGCWVLGSGTSLAAPHVSGLAAKLWNGSADATRRRLDLSAFTHDLYVAGDDSLTGFGLPTIEPLPVFQITPSAGPGGTVSPGVPQAVEAGAASYFTISPMDRCHAIRQVMVDGVPQEPNPYFLFALVRASHTLDVTFAPLGPFVIHTSAGPGGAITSNGASGVACGTDRTFAITPSDECHEIRYVKVDGRWLGAISSFTFTNVTSDHLIEAAFSALGPFTIQASAGPGATISRKGRSTVACGETVEYTIAPLDGCHAVADVRVDGVSVGPVTRYSFREVRGDHTIVASAAPTGLAVAETHTGASWGGLTDGAIDLTVSGGIPPYAYAWSNGATSQDLASLAAGTFDVRVTDAQGCTNALSVTIANVGPAEMTLTRPAPNPTTGPLQMRYGIPAQSAVRLSVLDIHGREVAVLVDGTQPSGWSYANWNGRTREGQAPGGVYFIRLQAGGRQMVHRFALVR